MSLNNSIEQNWEYWYPRVYGYFYKRVEDKTEVEDLTANTMTTVFMADNVLNFQAYMWRVAHNYLVKYINTKTTTPMPISLNEDFVSSQIGLPDEYQQDIEDQNSSHYDDKLTQLRECIDTHIKNEEEKQLLELSVIQEQNSTAIGELMNLKPDTVRQKISRLLRRLKQSCIQLWKTE
jgi:RNA polymerase sigma-70 factor, ECF subfamily